jgi:hypothetical protein
MERVGGFFFSGDDFYHATPKFRGMARATNASQWWHIKIIVPK